MLSILEALDESGRPEILDKEAKIEEAYELKNKGIPVSKIAEHFGVSPATIYNWHTKYIEQHRKRTESVPSIDILTEHLKFLDDLEQLCLYEANMLGIDELDDIRPPNTLRKKSEKVKFLKAAMDARQLKIQLQLKTGVLSVEPEKIYHAVVVNKPGETVVEDKPTRTKEEVADSIKKLLTYGRTLQ